MRDARLTLVSCCICLLPIPRSRTHRNDIKGNESDPLGRTMDHLHPRSRGGRRKQPAHRYCNSLKGARSIAEITVPMILQIQHTVIKLMADSGDRITAIEITFAREMMDAVQAETDAWRYAKWPFRNKEIQRWADDGGHMIPMAYIRSVRCFPFTSRLLASLATRACAQ